MNTHDNFTLDKHLQALALAAKRYTLSELSTVLSALNADMTFTNDDIVYVFTDSETSNKLDTD